MADASESRLIGPSSKRIVLLFDRQVGRTTSCAAVLLLLSCRIATPAYAATKTWTPTNGNNWATSGNWSPNGVPSASTSDSVTINSTTQAKINGTGAAASTVAVGTTAVGGTLFIQSGGVLTTSRTGNDSGMIAANAGSTGTVTIDGSGSKWNNSGNLDIGVSGTGSLTLQNRGAASAASTSIGNNSGSSGTLLIQSGGVLNDTSSGTSSAFIAGNSGSTGTATVTGSGSKWTNSGNLQVGSNGTGFLTVSNGGLVSDVRGYIATWGGSSGTATVTGAGSQWINSDNLYIGGYFGNGAGALTIQNNGMVSAAATFVGDQSGSSGRLTIQSGGVLSDASATPSTIGLNSGSSGMATVAGTGSRWTHNGDLQIGGAGAGTLSVASGGLVGDINGYIANNTASTGTVTVDGAGSKWTSSGTLTIGNSGIGALTLQNNGAASSAAVYIGRNGGSDGTLSILSGAALSTSTGDTNADNASIAVNAGATGAVTIDGSGSSWTNTSNLTVGGYGAGSLTIQNQGLAGIGTTSYVGNRTGSSGTLVIRGGSVLTNGVNGLGIGALLGNEAGATGTATVTGSASQWRSTGTLFIGNRGSGTLLVANGGSVSDAAGFLGGQTTGSGTVTITGAGSAWSNGGDLYLGALISNAPSGGSTATLTIADAGTVSTGAGSYLLGGSAPAPTLTPGSSSVYLGYGENSTATLNIGAPTTGAASAPGTLVASRLVFGPGAGTLNFNHTSPNYLFVPAMSGAGTINVLAGATILTGDSSGYTGMTAIASGATLQIGHGGTNGALGGTILDDGALAFNRADAFTVAAAIAGSGTIAQTGAGNTGFTGDGSTFNGATSVTGGTLSVNGTLGSTTSTVSVSNGGTLGGSGTIGGSVTIADGILAPGNSPGTLTIQGDLTLSSASMLDYQFGQAGVAGGSMNDLVNVGGNLTLAGTLNVSETAGGTYGAGVYHLFNYGGGLAYNGLAFGVMPADSTGYLQTSVAGQVNLVNNHGLSLSVWDGGTGAKDDGVIAGGSGVWTASSANAGPNTDNWTTLSATSNAPFTNPSFVLFQGQAGIVTVDASAGEIGVSGMQFATEGYRLQGDGITLAGAATPIRVGDGTNAGAAMTTTIDSALTGSGGLVKSDLGTLVLTGVNGYTGATTIDSGTLALASHGSIASSSGVIANGTFDVSGTNNGAAIRTLSGMGSVVLGSQNLTLTDAYDTFAGAITGAGGLSLTGGTETLTGQNSYTGTTTVGSGTLALAGNGSIAASSGVIANGIFDVSGTNNGVAIRSLSGAGTVTLGGQNLILTDAHDTFAGAITGTGGVEIAAGTASWTGGNTYSGLTTISRGTLQIGDGGTTGSLGTGSVVNNGTLAFDRADAIIVTNAISGTGAVAQIGIGNTMLSRGNAYSGGTTITAGALIGSANSFGSGTIADNGALVVDQPTDAVFSNAMSGSGTLIKRGAGTLNLTGDASAFTGATVLMDGGLKVNGSLAGSVVTAQRGTTLSGAGTVGGLAAQAGSPIAPGNSPGTLTVAGNYLAQSGSRYAADLVPGTTTSDRIVVGGAATIQDGAILQAMRDGAGAFLPNASYTVLTAAGGVRGSYTLTGDTAISAFYALRLGQDAQHVYLDAVQTRAFTQAASTRNQASTAAGLQGLPVGSALRGTIEALPEDAMARSAFDQGSGEIHASTRTAMLDDSRFMRFAAIDRLRSAFGDSSTQAAPSAADEADGPAFWSNGYDVRGVADSDGNAAKLSHRAGSFLIGADAAVLDVGRLGLLAGYGRATDDVRDRNSSGTWENDTFGAYGGAQLGHLGLRLGTAYTWSEVSTDRQVRFAGVSDRLSGQYDAGTFQAFGEVGYPLDAGKTPLGTLSFEPFAGLAYVDVRTEGFTEHGGLSALTAKRSRTAITLSTVGLRGASDFTIGQVALTASGSIAWRHAYGDITPKTSFTFVNSDPFDIAGVPIATDAALLEAGLATRLSGNVVLGVSYTGQFGDVTRSQGLRGTLHLKF